MSIPLLPVQPVGFPSADQALPEPDGLLAAGGALTLPWLLEAYSSGIFPWFDDDTDHILWWSPSQRVVLKPGEMKVRRSLRQRLRNAGFTVTSDEAFAEVMRHCGGPRRGQHGTWITSNMVNAYQALHDQGFAHSVETWLHGKLVGGLYGVSLGSFFFGESMFSHEADASKVAFFHLQQHLQQWGFNLIDCQIQKPHLQSLGVVEMPRSEFLTKLAEIDLQATRRGRWCLENVSANLNEYAG